MKKIYIVLTLLTAGALSAMAAENRPPRGDRPPPPPPEEMATRLITQFDADLSGALDQDELTAALTFMHENRPKKPKGNRPQAPATEDAGN